MKKSLIIKVFAFILCTVFLITAALSAFAVFAMAESGFYIKPLEQIRKSALNNTINTCAAEAARIFHYDSDEYFYEFVQRRNLYFEIRDGSGAVVYSNYKGQSAVFNKTFISYFEDPVYGENSDSEVVETDDFRTTTIESETLPYFHDTAAPDEIVSENSKSYYYNDPTYKIFEYSVTVYLPSEYFTTDMISFIDGFICGLYQMKDALGIIFLGSLFLFIVLFVILCSVSGWKKGFDKPRTCFFDRLPFDLFTLIYCLAAYVIFCIFSEIYFETIEFIAAVVLTIVFGSLLLVSYFYSLAARAKTGELIKNTFVFIVLSGVYKAIRFVIHFILKIFNNLHIYGKTVVLLLLGGLWSFITLLFAFDDSYEGKIFSAVLWLVGGTIVSIFALYLTEGMNKLVGDSDKISKGEIGHRINIDRMPSVFKAHACSINNIGAGMAVALEERMKSERLKTELITNVSHDLKTPLTSIINYIDLIKNERKDGNGDEEKISEYIEVLDRQSSRLRKLTEDLVEASKAQSGNLELEKTQIDLCEMIAQIDGEYSERLNAPGLSMISRYPEDSVMINADGKHIWRIFDNLMNNILKYSMEGSRVYIDVEKIENRAYVIFRNTSKYQLRVRPDELTERFVRGDVSRHEEGSGLGLSIARSLAELNGGRLEIFTDGDLFKVVLSFDEMKLSHEVTEDN